MSTVPRSSAPPSNPSSPPPLHSAAPSTKSSSRSRWFFKSSTPPTSPPPRTPSKHFLSKPDRRTRPGPRLQEPRLSLPPPLSDRSSRSSTDDRRSYRHPEVDSHHSLRLTSSRPSPASSLLPPTPAPQRPPPPLPPTPTSLENFTNDWGVDETPENSHDPHIASPSRHFSTTISDYPAASSQPSEDSSFPHVLSTDSLRPSRCDTLTLHAFDETQQRHTSVRTELPPASSVIGVYADPAAETDDWGDDFVIDDTSLGPRSTVSLTFDNPSPPLPSWIDDSDAATRPDRTDLRAQRTPQPPTIQDTRPPPHPATAEISPAPDDALPMRPLPADAFATPQLTHSSLLMYPGIGYNASAVPPSCSNVKHLFATHGPTIRRHFDALVRDSGGTIAFDDRTRSLYLLSIDPDVAVLTSDNADLAMDVLSWKLEWAALTDDHALRARTLLSFSKLHKDTGNITAAMNHVRDALHALSGAPTTTLSLALAAELEYESAILHRAIGAFAEAGRSLKRAMARSATLAEGETPEEPSVPGARQRGFWWQLRCKFLRADIAYDVDEMETAVQFYSEYIIESVSRMIGEIAPPESSDVPLGPEYMRFCLLSPRRVVLALWATVLCLGGLHCFAAAADLSSLTALTASAFGYEDAGEAAANVRGRIKDIGDELTSQYEDISKSILQSDETEQDDIHGGPVQNMSQIPSKPFDYSGGDFGGVGDDIIEDWEDWDAQIERELNIRIERLNDVDAEDEREELADFQTNEDIVSLGEGSFAHSLLDQTAGGDQVNSLRDESKAGPRQTKQQSAKNKWSTVAQEGQLIEAELRQYLHRLAGAVVSTLSSQQMYPKPTEPFDGHLMDPREHENFLRTFVRSKDPEQAKKILRGVSVTPEWHPSVACKLNFNIEPIEDIDAFNSGIQILSPNWGVRFLEAVWKVVRSQVAVQTKQSRLRRLMLNALSKVAATSKKTPVQDDVDRRARLEMLGALLDALRLAREVVTDSGKEAVWFSRACMFLGIAAATVSTTAKAAVELLQAENRAHCGVRAVVSSVMLDRCAKLASDGIESDSELFSSGHIPCTSKHSITNDVPAALRQTVVDLMHALYWRTKAGFDESSDSVSLEKLLHAEVASSLFLTGSGISPVDGSKIDLSKEIQILHIPKKRQTKSVDSNTLVDETRRVSSSELIFELQKLWTALPSSAGFARAKVALALAHHNSISLRNYARAERYLFDGLRCVHMIPENQSFPNSFFSRMLLVSPVSLVSAPLIGAILNAYSSLTISHSKSRYGVAALEAACDAVRVRNMDNQAYRAFSFEVVERALSNNDWRRALTLLSNLRSLIHPKNGLRNEFIHLCVKLHRICFDVGCLDASIVPLRAYSSLIYEERLRVLLQRYKRRLAKKSRSRIRRYISGSHLPKLLPGPSLFSSRKNTLASFFEIPVVPVRNGTVNRRSSTENLMRSRLSTVVVPQSPPPRNTALGALLALLWPLQFLFSQSRSAEKDESKNSSPSKKTEGAASTSQEESKAIRSEPEKPHEQSEKPAAVKKKVPGSKVFVDKAHLQEQRELLRIEAEQEDTADSDRCHVELLRAETDLARADYTGAEQRCRGLLRMSIPSISRYKVCEIMARIRLKRREITRCLELIDQMERENHRIDSDRNPSKKGLSRGDDGSGSLDDNWSLSEEGRLGEDSYIPNEDSHDGHRKSFFRKLDAEKMTKSVEHPNMYLPQVTFLRLRALTHGGRLDEALQLADKAINSCGEASFWDKGRLHYLRGKVLYIMSCTSSPSFREDDNVNVGASEKAADMTLKVTELTLAAFETASHFYYAAGDEICTAKSDLLWARTCIDFLFRRVVLKSEAGGGTSLNDACQLPNRRIDLGDLQEVVYNVLSVASNANIPLLLINAMAALAEVKCIRGHATSSWSSWISECWKLFSRLYINAEDFTVVVGSIAPVSFLTRLKDVCGRLVRLVMCNESIVPVFDMNKHLRLFEAYVTLQLSIDHKMNLASGDRQSSSEIRFAGPEVAQGSEANITDQPMETDSQVPVSQSAMEDVSPSSDNMRVREASSLDAGVAHTNLSKAVNSHEQHRTPPFSEAKTGSFSEATSDLSTQSRPAGAFLHMIGNEGIALGRQGFSLFINRPRKQVISAVRGTGAVFIPTNFFTNSKTTPGFQSHQLGKDAEMIFPFKPSLGLGAMQILNDETETVDAPLHHTMYSIPGTSMAPETFLKNAVQPSNNSEMRSHSDAEGISVDENLFRGSPGSTPHSDPEGEGSRANILRHQDVFGSGMSDHASNSQANDVARKTEGSTTARQSNPPNELSLLLNTVWEELEQGTFLTKGSSTIFGLTTAAKVWAHHHRIKSEAKRYMHGEISLEQLHERNNDALLSWVHCIPISGKQWTVPESVGRRLVYILCAHGIVGYYAVERGGSIERVAFGGKQEVLSHSEGGVSQPSTQETGPSLKQDANLRAPTNAEQMYLYEMVKGFKRDGVWHKNRDSEIVSGLANFVLKAPRLILSATSPSQKSRSRPIVLIADLSLQILPWELFFEHVVVRSHCLLDVIRGAQDELTRSSGSLANEDRATAANRRIVRFINFVPSRKEVVDLERTEEARRQQLAFQGLLRLHHQSAASLISFLDIGGFSDPTAVNAVARPMGPLSSSLSQSRKAVQLFGMRIAANIGKRNYPHLDFLKVAGLGSASTEDLKEAAMVVHPGLSDADESRRDLGAYILVFMFSYADLVDSSESVFGLRRAVPMSILMFTPAVHMKVLARHLEDEELAVELGRASGRVHNWIIPDVVASARVLVEYVSRFSREKRIPIVVFLGQGLVEVFPTRNTVRNEEARSDMPAAERFVQLSGGGRGVGLQPNREGERVRV